MAAAFKDLEVGEATLRLRGEEAGQQALGVASTLTVEALGFGRLQDKWHHFHKIHFYLRLSHLLRLYSGAVHSVQYYKL